MSDSLVTIATFATPVEAQLARNVLEAEGIAAVVADEETIGMFGYLGNAMGGIKVQVREDDWLKARLALSKHLHILDEGEDQPEEGEPEADEGDEEHITEKPLKRVPLQELEQQIAEKPIDVEAPPEEGDDDDWPPESEGDALAHRAFKAAVIGVFVCPPFVTLYSMYLLWRLSDYGQLEPRSSIKALVALIFNVLVLGAIATVMFAYHHW